MFNKKNFHIREAVWLKPSKIKRSPQHTQDGAAGAAMYKVPLQDAFRRWRFRHGHRCHSDFEMPWSLVDMGMDQYLLIPFLVGWTSIYQLFWCSPGVQGFDTLPYMFIESKCLQTISNGGLKWTVPKYHPRWGGVML